MTHKRMLATNANTLYTAESLDIRAIGGAHENTCRRLSDRRGVSPAAAIAQISLMLIVLLIMAHSGYWALLLPSWIAFAAFLAGASDPAEYENGRAVAQGGSL